jgi:hypothetical protein
MWLRVPGALSNEGVQFKLHRGHPDVGKAFCDSFLVVLRTRYVSILELKYLARKRVVVTSRNVAV